MSGNMTRKGVLTKDINTAIICIGLHGGWHRNYFALFGRVPTDGNIQRSHVCHQSSLSEKHLRAPYLHIGADLVIQMC